MTCAFKHNLVEVPTGSERLTDSAEVTLRAYCVTHAKKRRKLLPRAASGQGADCEGESADDSQMTEIADENEPATPKSTREVA